MTKTKHNAFEKEIDMYLCHKFRIELDELHSLDAESLKQIRSDYLFEVLGK
jgi:hypothetical protein